MTKKHVLLDENNIVVMQDLTGKPPKEYIPASEEVAPGWKYNTKTKKFSAPKVALNIQYEIKNIRDKKINGGISVNGIELATDDTTQSRIMAARIMAKEDSKYTVNWKTNAGFVPLDAATIVALSDAIHDHVQACFTAEANTDLTDISDIKGLQSAYDAQYVKAISA
jgi:hypothetical protein